MTTKYRSMRALTVAMILLLSAFSVAAQQDKSMAQIRVAHLSSDAGQVDIYINEEAALIGVDFGDISAWATVPAGNYDIAVVPAGESIDESISESVNITFEEEQWHSVAAIGLVGDSSLEVRVIQEDFSEIAPGETRLTVFHAIPNTGPVSLLVNNTLLVAGLAYPTESNDGLAIIDIVEGSYDLKIQLTENSDVVIFEIPDQLFTSNRNYFIAAAGSAARPELVFFSTNPTTINNLLVISDDDDIVEDAHVRVGHFAEGMPGIDVYIDGQLSNFTDVQYDTLENWVNVSTGTHRIAITPTGTPLNDAMIESTDITLAKDGRYTIAVIGLESDSDNPVMMKIIDENYSKIPESEAHITVLHANPSALEIDIVINGDIFARGLTYSDTSGNNAGVVSFNIMEGIYSIQIIASDDPENILLDLSDIEIESGYHYFMATINTSNNLRRFLNSRTASKK